MANGSLRTPPPNGIRKLNVRQIHQIRSLIDVGRVVRRLQGFALSEWEMRRTRDADGVETFEERPIEMNAHQVRAAGMLLDRVMPVLQSMQLEVQTTPFEGQSVDQLRAQLRRILTGAETIDVQAIQVTPVEEDLLSLDGNSKNDLLSL